jgi:hypothetical protein
MVCDEVMVNASGHHLDRYLPELDTLDRRGNTAGYKRKTIH